MNILIIAKLSNKKLLSKISPIIHLEKVKEILLVRSTPINLPKVKCFCPPAYFQKNLILTELYRIFFILYLLTFRKISLVIGINFYFHGLYTVCLGKLFGKKTVVSIIGSDLMKLKKNILFQKILSFSNAITSRGISTTNEIEKFGIDRNKIFSPPNVIDLSKNVFQDKIKKSYDLIFIGNMVKVKRVDILIQIIRSLKTDKKIDGIRAAILGDGVELSQHKKNVIKLGLSENVIFLGHRPNVFQYLKKSKIFILTSEFEGLPQVMIEAMSSGLPCVVPNISDITTIAKDGWNSKVIPPLDVPKFVKAVYDLLTDDVKYKQMSDNALKICKDKEYEYSTLGVSKIWLNIFKNL